MTTTAYDDQYTSISDDKNADEFDSWFARYLKEACEIRGGLEGVDPRQIANDAWQAANENAPK